MRYLLASALSLTIVGVVLAADADLGDLITKLASKETSARRQAANELADMGPEAGPASAALRKAVKDPDAYVRRFSAQALGKIGGEAKDVKTNVTTLTLALSDEKQEVQLAAIDGLVNIGPHALDSLMAALKDPTRVPAVRKKAAQGLGKIGPAARGAVGVLSMLVTNKAPKNKAKGKDLSDEDVRIDAAAALGKVAKKDDKVAIDALKQIAESKQRNKALLKAAQDSLRELTGSVPPKKKKK
jgi:HEAT repeat protein